MAGSPKKRAKREASRELVVIPPPQPDEEPKDRFGRSHDARWNPDYVDIAKILCEEGMTDRELAAFFGISKPTLYKWQFTYPEFAAAMKLGKEPANDRLERRAYEVAMGYTYTIRDAVKIRDRDGSERIELSEREVEIPPNPDMLRWMLKNRRPEVWKDKTEQLVAGEVVHLTLEQAKERLRTRLEQLKQIDAARAG